MLLDVIGVDYSRYSPAKPKPFAVIYNISHPRDHRRLFLRVWLDGSEAVPSLYSV